MRSSQIRTSMLAVPILLLSACAPQVQAQAPLGQDPAASSAVPTSPPGPTVDPAEFAVAAEAAPSDLALLHASVPGGVPDGTGIFLGDQSTVSSYNSARAFSGDRFTLGKFERPYNSGKMDVYYPFLDIVSASFYPDSDWVYVRITLVGPDANNAFPGKYAVEIDPDMDGRGDLLLIADYPSSTKWSTDRVRVLEDANQDVGGEKPLLADSAGRGDGFETVIFDQGQGNDPDAAWARVSSAEPNSVEMAFKTSLLQGDKTYLAGIWAGTDILDPALFDLNDHFTHEQAGEANPDIANYYPIKLVAELDNTCRQAIGFTPSGHELGLCPQGQ